MVNQLDQRIALIRDFVNTAELDEDIDQLATPAELGSWLAEHGLAERGWAPSARDRREAVNVREAIRTLLLANNEVNVDTGPACETLDEAARRARLGFRFRADGTAIESASPLGRLLAAVAELMGTDDWSRLKACRADSCRWAFYDSAKNKSRAWCSMKVCGNREKARAFRERHS